MNTKELKILLGEVEARFPVDAWQSGSLKLWPLIRYHLYEKNHSLLNRLAGTQESPAPPGRFDRLAELGRSEWSWLKANAADFARTQLPPAGTDVLLYSDGVSQIQLGGKWFDRFVDPVAFRAEDLGFRTHTWTPARHFFTPRGRPSWFIQPVLDALGVYCKATHRFRRTPVVVPGYDEFVRYVDARFPRVDLPDVDGMEKAGYYVEQHVTLYRALLTRLRPKVCFLVCYYGMERFSLMRACRQLGIPTVDLQHGYAGAMHFAYAAWERVPPGGYDLLPEVFWCWTEEDRRVVEAWAERTGGAHRAEVAGNVFFAGWAQTLFPGIGEVMARGKAVRALAPDATHLLVTLNGYEPRDLLRHLAAVFGRMSDVYVWLRMHPVRMQQRAVLEECFHALGPGRVCIEEPSMLPLPVVLSHVDLHATEVSSTVLEAELFGIPSVLLGSGEATSYAESIERGAVHVAEHLDDLPRVVRSLRGKRLERRGATTLSFDRLLVELVQTGAELQRRRHERAA